jgi:hypothetical protein
MKVVSGEINTTMEVCNKCLEVSRYCPAGKVNRCEEHKDLPEDSMGAVPYGSQNTKLIIDGECEGV